MLVREVFGQEMGRAYEPHPQVQGTIGCGVEIELENINNSTQLNSEFWVTTTDGSLRNNGREFVFNGPRGGSELFSACVDLDSFLVRQNPDANWRCSTHVHVDMRWSTVEQLKKIIVANIVYEKFLFRMSGFNRYRNNFCAAIGFAQDQLNTLAQHWNLNDDDFLRGLAHNWDKYSALNLRPLATFGSIEFRSSNAEWRKGKLIRLCNRFLGLVEYASSFDGSLEEMINDMAGKDPRQIMRKGFQNTALPEGWQEDISTGVKLAHDLLTFTRMPEAVITYGLVRLNSGPFVPVARDNARWVRDTLTLRYGYQFTGTFRNMDVDGRNYTAFPLKAIRDIIREHNINPRDFLDSAGLAAFQEFQDNDTPDEESPAIPASRTINFTSSANDWRVTTSNITQALARGESIEQILGFQTQAAAPVPVEIGTEDEDEDDEEFF